MKKKFIQVILICSILVIQKKIIFAQEFNFAWDFTDCAIQDILYAVSLDSGISIIADDTVSGNGNFKFSGNDFEKAFDAFLLAGRLYVNKQDDFWIVSKIKIEEENGIFTLDAFDVTPSMIFEKLSEKTTAVISYESLPLIQVSVHYKGLSEKVLIENIVHKFPDYFLEQTESGYHIGKQTSKITITSNTDSDNFKVELKQDGSFYIEAKDAKVIDVIEKLFSLSDNKQFCFLINHDNKISRCCFVAHDFEQAVKTLCSQNGLKSLYKDGIYYIFLETQTKENLIAEKRNWEKISLKNVKADRFISAITKSFGKLETIILPDSNSFLCFLTEEEKQKIKSLVNAYDVKLDTYVINLKYINSEELLKCLPSSVEKSGIITSPDNSCIYFSGTESAYKDLSVQIENCDRPASRLSYDILILQYDESSDNSWSSNVKAERLKGGSFDNLSLSLGSILNLNFDVITTFGLQFAQSLQSSIENNSAKVYADTTLHGVSGKQIYFQNTNTYRYRDNNLDPETGKPVYSGITREITSGLKLEITGWVSGNGMITSTVTASVTRQGTDTSSFTGNPPPTTEKLVTTEVCGKSGEPIILSGLIQNSENEYEKRVPVISKLPILGPLFKSKSKSKQHTQMIIYLVPHIDEYGSIFIKRQTVFNKDWAKRQCKIFSEKLR